MFHTPLSQQELERSIAEIQPLKHGFDAVSDHVVITDPHGNILYANRAVETNTGYTQQEMIGKNPADLWGGNMPKEFYKKMWQVIKVEKKPFVDEVKNKRKDGREYWQELHISPVLGEDGKVQFFIGIEPNITERKEKDRFREEFISILAHQAKSPLLAVKWAIEWIFKKGGVSPDQKNMLETIYQSNQSLSNLVGDLLTLSRIGNVEAKVEELDLVQEIEGIAQNVGRLHPTTRITFEHEGQYLLRSNQSLVSQVFINLISNAAEYSDNKSGRVMMALTRETDRYIFSVENNGLSIPPEDKPKIFSKFFRATNAKQAKKSGSGLGLFIVKTICDSLGWDVSFESPAPSGTGAIFTVKLPR